MRTSKTLAKIRAGEVARVCGLGHFIPSYIKHAAHFGYDCIWLDLEHRCINDREIQALMAFFHLFDVDCMLRTPTFEKTRLYRYLEDGVTGLMISHVSTPEKAAELADSVKFPPIGDRGLDGAGLDGDFFLDDLQAYPDKANRETFLIVQIETIQAVENVDAIAATPGVDGLFIGPGDLGMRIQRTETSLTLADAQRQVAAAAARHGKAWGQPTSCQEDIQRLASMGAQIIAHGNDFSTLMNMLKSSADEFTSALEKS